MRIISVGPLLALSLLLLARATGVVSAAFVPYNFRGPPTSRHTHLTSFLSMSLKPAAIPLMDSGKALARSGELLIEMTSDLEIYGGALSASGALIRNAGDAIAQAAALCRFKTGAELACDELREAATCLTEARDKLQQAVVEGETDDNAELARKLSEFPVAENCHTVLESILGSDISLKSSSLFR